MRVFAPATVANLGPGFDVLGLAVEGLGDWVEAERIDGPPGVELDGVSGDGGRLPREVDRNTAAVAARSAALRLGIRVRLRLEKGLPLSSGLGSSAASAVAGAVAAAVLGGVPLDERASLLGDTLAGEAVASGAAHADNVGPSLLGGAVLIHSPGDDPPGLVALPVPDWLWVALALPDLELETRRARAALPRHIDLHAGVVAWGRVAGLVASFYRGDPELLRHVLRDDIVEPARGPLIQGFAAVKTAALETGALACTISGAGPTVFALADSRLGAESAAAAMVTAWRLAGVEARPHVARPDLRGARVV